MIFWTVKYTNTQIQIHKYINTAYDKVPEIPNIICIFEQDVKNDNPSVPIRDLNQDLNRD